MTRRVAVFCLAAVVALTLGALNPKTLLSADFPTRAVEVVVPFGAGSIVDRILLTMIPYLEKDLGQKVLPNYKSGAGGSIGAAWLAQAQPTGYDIGIMANGPILIRPVTSNLTYSLKDFVPIAQVGTNKTYFWVRSDSRWKTAKDLFEDAKQNPDRYTFGTAGAYSAGHMRMETLKLKMPYKLKHVPFESSHKAYLALLGSQIDFVVTELPSELLKDGKVVPIVTFSERRTVEFPNVPTFKELGYDVQGDVLYCFVAPKGTPPAVIERLEAAFQRTTTNPDFARSFLQNIGVPVEYLGSRDLAQKLDKEYATMKEVAANLNLKKE